MPVAKLHRYIFLMLCAVIVLLVAQLAYTTYRLNRLEGHTRDLEYQAANRLHRMEQSVEEIVRMTESTLAASKKAAAPAQSLDDVGRRIIALDEETVDVGFLTGPEGVRSLVRRVRQDAARR
jgi:hypothetical protein